MRVKTEMIQTWWLSESWIVQLVKEFIIVWSWSCFERGDLLSMNLTWHSWYCSQDWDSWPVIMSVSRGHGSKSQRKGSTLESIRRRSSKKDIFSTVTEGLRQHYQRTLRPFEDTHLFHTLHSPPLEDAEFYARPSVLLVGQYSTGKTTFIRCDIFC